MNTTATPNINSLEALQQEVIVLKEKLAWYEEQFRLHKQQQFGASIGRSDQQEQLVFNEPEKLEEELVTEKPETQTLPAHERKKPVRKPLPKDLPREVVVLDIEETEKTCPGCKGDLNTTCGCGKNFDTVNQFKAHRYSSSDTRGKSKRSKQKGGVNS